MNIFGLNYPKGEKGQGESTGFLFDPLACKGTFEGAPFPLLKILKIYFPYIENL